MNLNKVLLQISHLDPGDVLQIPCRDFQQAERVRGRLYRSKAKLVAYNPAIWEAVAIARKKEGDHFCITVTLADAIGTATIIRKNGMEETVVISSDPPELTSIMNAMADDMVPQEEIDKYAEEYRREHAEADK